FDVFHHQKEDAVRTFSEVCYVNNVWMSNGRSGASFTFESSDCFTFLEIFIVENIWPDGLDGDSPRLEILIAREVDLAHRTSSQTFFEKITRGQEFSARKSCFSG